MNKTDWTWVYVLVAAIVIVFVLGISPRQAKAHGVPPPVVVPPVVVAPPVAPPVAQTVPAEPAQQPSSGSSGNGHGAAPVILYVMVALGLAMFYIAICQKERERAKEEGKPNFWSEYCKPDWL